MNPTESALLELIKPVIESEEYRHSFWGISVADLATGEPLLDLNGDKLFVPASTTKLWSCAMALNTFGADYRFTTPVHLRGDVNADGTLIGDLILRASGDPNLSGRMDSSGHLVYTNTDHTYSGFMRGELTGIDPLEGIEDLTQQIADRCTRRVHDVLIDDRLFDRSPRERDATLRSSPVMVNDNLIDIIISPGDTPGKPAKIETKPVTRAVSFDFQVKTVQAGEGNDIQVVCTSPTTYTVKGRIEVGQKPLMQIAWLLEPADFARAVLIECLEKKGIEVERSGQSAQPPENLPDPAEYERLPIIARRVSAPFYDAMKVILKVSHNTHADALPQLVASRYGKRTVQEGLHLQWEFLESIGIEKGTVCFGSGAGGSRSDRVAPRAALRLLRYMATRPDAEDYRLAMPILGVDGTLYNAVKPESPARGKVFAKTGTIGAPNLLDDTNLLVSKALAGYMTAASDRKVVLAMFVNEVPIQSNAETARHGQVLGTLCEILYQAL
jgi:serine-type D-Ala-D-Ala carboxypeptidase/endopeptidase (penicillin-binding protein 4)